MPVSRSLRGSRAEEFIAAAGGIGLAAHADASGEPHGFTDVMVVVPGRAAVRVRLTSASSVGADAVQGHVRRWSDHQVVVGSGSESPLNVVVADRITAGARQLLNEAGWGWLDLRGHLRLWGAGLYVDADVPAQSALADVRSGLIGQVGLELAVLLLMHPQVPVAVRAAAATLSRAPSSVSESLAALRVGGLVDARGAAAVPELFWELAERWKPISRDLASLPDPGANRDTAPLRLGLADVETTMGWALSDTTAAAAYEAPVAVRGGYPPDFYVPDEATLRRAVHLLGEASSSAVRAGRVRVAPTAAVCTRRVDATPWALQPWPLAHPLFVALDLAQDPGRGREILAGWTPREPWPRVW